MKPTPVLLVVLDGWGIAKKTKGNAVENASPLFFNRLKAENPYAVLDASGESVGLLRGNMGNSEVGHLHIGAGRLVQQDLARIFASIKDGSFYKNKVLVSAMKKAKGRALHLMGLLSDGGVHSHIGHLFALLKMAKKFGLGRVYVHAFLDGRDVPPKSALNYISLLEAELAKLDRNWKIATVIGRYYSMDRDNRWNREHKAYDAMVNARGHYCKSAKHAVLEAYRRSETDEFVRPSIVAKEGIVREGDTIIFFNFRSDRARQLTRAFVQGRFNKFRRRKLIKLNFVCMTQYDPGIRAPVAFPPVILKNTLGEVISNAGLRQFRLAETEKWAHVTYFFNGLSGRIFSGEDRLLVPSPKVTTYDKRPEMSAYKITKKALEVLGSKKYSFVLVNFANPDMVGHTGNYERTVQAVRVVDNCLKELVPFAIKNGYAVVITADHGNAEQMLYPDGSPCTSHTANKVPLVITGAQFAGKKLKKRGCLYNIAPTILDLMGLKRPKEMAAGLLC